MASIRVLVVLFTLWCGSIHAVEALSACEPDGEGTFRMLCICAREAGNGNVETRDISNEMPKHQPYPSEQACEKDAARLCEAACNKLVW